MQDEKRKSMKKERYGRGGQFGEEEKFNGKTISVITTKVTVTTVSFLARKLCCFDAYISHRSLHSIFMKGKTKNCFHKMHGTKKVSSL